MTERWLILADDLTGAADSAIAFARRGLPTRILVGEKRVTDERAAVLAFDADTRRLTPALAAERHRAGMQRFGAPGAGIFKKIDSTLRGHPAIEIAAVLESLAAYGRENFGVLAPAFPAMGRTTREGHVYVHGKPLEESETWRREHAYPNADLGEILSGAGMHTLKLSLAQVRAGETQLCEALRAFAHGAPASRGRIAICDAENDVDLDIIAGASRFAAGQSFVIGTAGLAHAIARRLPKSSRPQSHLPPSSAGALIVVGSLASISRQAARELAALPGVTHLRIRPETLLDARFAELRISASGDAIRAIEAGNDVLVEIVAEGEPDLAQGPRIVSALGELLHAAMCYMSGMIVTGGETAAALLAALFVMEIDLLDETEPGVCLGIARRSSSFPLVTKAGAFGDARSLVRALEKLRMIRKSGVLA
jgi:uncharacterized protein YgbK (DUF1537 family)